MAQLLLGLHLSPAEIKVVHQIKGGLTNKAAATELFVSEKTIKFHLTSVFKKCGVQSRGQLIYGIGKRSLPSNIMKQLDQASGVAIARASEVPNDFIGQG